jgi:hypothetical protein
MYFVIVFKQSMEQNQIDRIDDTLDRQTRLYSTPFNLCGCLHIFFSSPKHLLKMPSVAKVSLVTASTASLQKENLERKRKITNFPLYIV